MVFYSLCLLDSLIKLNANASLISIFSLLVRFADDKFDPNEMPTIGVDFKVKKMEIDGDPIHLQIWDTAGLVYLCYIYFLCDISRLLYELNNNLHYVLATNYNLLE